MARKGIRVNTNAVADTYAGPDEKVIEYSSPNGGGLIAFRMTPDGRLTVYVYRQDATVDVRIAEPEA